MTAVRFPRARRARAGAPTGSARALWIARCSHALVVVGLVSIGLVAGLGKIYAFGVGLVALLLVVENALVRPGDYRHVNLAFFTVNGAVSVALAGTAILDIFAASPATSA